MTAPEVTVPTAAPLQRVPNVELMHAGTWNASTGTHTFTADDFANASAANACPAVRRPILKLGHTDPRFDGEPAIGYVDHVRAAEDGHALVGDFAGMPGWLTPEVMASAWPDRSIEGEWDFECALGHSHGFVVTAVALLGVSPPAIGTLQSFQDIAALYAVGDTNTNEDETVPSGKVTLNAGGAVNLSVTSEDIRRAFYDRDDVAWSSWVEEIQLSPELQVIVHDDNTNQRSRVPVVVDSAADGTAAVSFGNAVPVVVRYEDVASPVAAAAAGSTRRVMFSSRDASRTNVQATQEEPPVTTLNEALAAHLGVDADADDAALIAALEARGTAAPVEPATAPNAAPVAPAEPNPPTSVQASAGTVTLDETTYNELRRTAQLGAQAYERQVAEDRERIISDAVRAGRFAPARADHFRALLAADPEGGRATIESLSPGLIPVDEVGHNHGSAAASAGNDDVNEDPRYKSWSI